VTNGLRHQLLLVTFTSYFTHHQLLLVTNGLCPATDGLISVTGANLLLGGAVSDLC